MRRAVRHGAIAWLAYGLVETALLMLVPAVKQAVATLAPSLDTGSRTLGNTAVLAGVLLLTYPLVGGATGGLLAAALAVSQRGRRLLVTGAQDVLWSGIGGLTLGTVFALHAVSVGEAAVVPASVLPLVLAAARVREAWRPTGRSSWSSTGFAAVFSLLLVGGALIAQPRPYIGLTLRGALLVAFSFVTLAVALLLRRGRRRSPASPPSVTRPPRWVAALVVLSCLGVGLWWLLPRSGPSRVPPLSTAGGAAALPNVVLIVMDTVRADHVSAHGYERDTTPNLRRLATEHATLYTRAIATSNWTLPAQASMLTGQMPSRHGAYASESHPAGRAISWDSPTMAELLAAEGYTTAGFVANCAVLVPAFGFNRGFHRYEPVCIDEFFTATGRAYLLRETARDLVTTVLRPGDRELVFARAEQVNRRAVEFLQEAAAARRPFFLFLNYMDAHTPFLPPAPFDRRFEGKDPAFRWKEDYTRIVDEVVTRRTREIADAERRHLVSQYDGAIAYLDDQLGLLFARLAASGVYDSSLIVVTSDHGEAFGEAHAMFHGESLHQHQVHVPLLIKLPHASAPSTVDALVSGSDLLPTVLDVVGVPPPRSVFDGRSLLRSEALASRFVVSESFRPRARGPVQARPGPLEMAFFSGPLKRIVRPADGAAELYDLAADPGETVNLEGKYQVPDEWQAMMTTYLSEVGRRSPVTRSVTDPEVIERLRSLGYVR